MTGAIQTGRRAFVFGNAAFDEVFDVRDLPAPGESVLGTAVYAGLGGKGANQAIALARTGVPTIFVTAIGADPHGQAIRRALGGEPLDRQLLERADLPSDRSIVFAGQDGDNVIVTTTQCAQSLTLADCLPVLRQARPGDAVLLQGNLTLDVTAGLAKECERLGLAAILNPSPFNDAFATLLPLTHALFVNGPEAKGLTGHAGREAVAALLDAGARTVVLTLGAEGALLGSRRGIVHVPAFAARVVDVTGAGDCFEGVAVGSAMLRGTDLDETAIRHGSAAAAHAIAGIGAAQSFPDMAQVSRILADTSPA